MNWSSWSEFFSMGGYGLYVWGSYAVAVLCIVAESIANFKSAQNFGKTIWSDSRLKYGRD
jgi:heme exporter protein D